MLIETWSLSRRRLRAGAHLAVASVVAALLSCLAVAFLARHRPEPVALCITAAIIALSLVRSDERPARSALPAWARIVARGGMVPLAALLGSSLGPLGRDRPVLGLVLIGLPLVLAIWVRRFGPAWSRLGSLWSFPFIAALITPAAAVSGPGGSWWGALAALVAVGWATLLGFVAAAPAALRAPAATGTTPGEPDAVRRPAGGRRRLAASDRMALQLAVALAASLAAGELLLPDHLGWVVLTAYLVQSANRGRADVAYKGALRVIGALGGTLAATVLGGAFAPGDSAAVAVMFLILGAGAVLRPASYAWWAAAMTGALALLYGYLGQGGTGLLGERLWAILLGGALSVAAGFLVLPVRSVDVLRRRTAELLGIGREVLTADRTGPGHAAMPQRVHEAVERVEQLAAPLHALRLVTLGRVAGARAPADLLDRAVALREPLLRFAAAPSRELVAEVRSQLGGTRTALLALRRD